MKNENLILGMVIHSLYAVKKNMLVPQNIRSKFGEKHVDFAKALVEPATTFTPGYAAELSPIQQLQEEYIELLRPRSILYQLRNLCINLQFDASNEITIPKALTGNSGGWFVEGSPIPVSAMSFGLVSLKPKNEGVIAVLTNKLLMRSDPAALELVQNDLLDAVSSDIDKTFISNDAATSVAPAGIQTLGTRTAATGNDLNAITNDFKGMIGRLLSTNLTLQKPIWLMSETNKSNLSFLRDGLGTYIYRDELKEGKLHDYPVISSNHVPADICILIDVSQLLTGLDILPQLSLSTTATLEMTDTPDGDLGATSSVVRSLFQTASSAIRVISSLDWSMRHDNVVQTLHGLDW